MSHSDLERVAAAMVAKGKGILAADESNATCTKRFEKIGIPSTEEHRRAYRELLFTTPEVAQWISGVILYDETIRQKTREGQPFAEYLTKAGMLPGIKVDTGAKALALHPHETITEGLDGLRERFIEYYRLGARFAKWRAVIDIGAAIPTRSAIEANAHALARYAALCQEQNIVPIVEPEVLMDGAHTLERCEEVTDATLAEVFAQLLRARVYLEGMILKPNMVIAGKKCPTPATPEQVAAATLRCLKRHVPAAVPGVAFLSGGQSSTEAALHLSLMNRLGPLPWQLSFSYGRALQDAALSTWGGKSGNVPAAQKEFQKWARLNGLARSGAFQAGMEQQAA
ncbi:MAG TPA: class I fructose-bisphosphate aldolase [Steroidobacteraceae bacterium]